MIVPTAVAQATPQQDSYAYPNVATTEQSQVVNLIFWQTNAERTKRGLQPLKTDAQPQARAQQWSNYMASNGNFVDSGDPDSNKLVETWMNSDGHRKNIPTPDITKIGKGAVYNPSNGCWYATQQMIW